MDENIEFETAKEVVRLSELYIDGTLRLALAADTRVMQLSGVCAAAASGFLGAGLALLPHQNDRLAFCVGIGLIVAAVGFAVDMAFAILAAKPRPFAVGGTYLSVWRQEELTGSLTQALMSQARVYDVYIHDNLRVLAENASNATKALNVLIFIPFMVATAIVISVVVTHQ